MSGLITDIHTHSAFSVDSDTPPEKMLETAYRKGVAFYGVSDHFNYEQRFYFPDNTALFDIDEEGYFHKARHLQEDYAGSMNVLVGAEFGFGNRPEIFKFYETTYEKYKPDFVVNSVHTLLGKDYYNMGQEGYFTDKQKIYSTYLQSVRESLDAPYPYDIVGHIGYATRYTSFADRRILLSEFGELIDDILKTIIQKNKILEINSSNKGGVSPFLPSNEIIQRYFDLGGRKVSYASDAHFPERICEKREEVVALLKQIGFTYITVPCKGEHIKVEI